MGSVTWVTWSRSVPGQTATNIFMLGLVQFRTTISNLLKI